MRMKRPQGYKHIKCPHCGEKIRLIFRTMHRMKLEVERATDVRSRQPGSSAPTNVSKFVLPEDYMKEEEGG